MAEHVEFYTPQTIDMLRWPETVDGAYARSYLLPFFQHTPSYFIANIYNTEMRLARIGDVLLPITVADFHPQNSYTVSPYSHYISYGVYEEVELLNTPLLEDLVKTLIAPIDWYFRAAHFDRVVYVNNWLLSTNLYPAMRAEQLEAVANVLPPLYPDRPIIFRSLDQYSNSHLFEALLKAGYRMILSRQVWYWDPAQSIKTRQFKEDLRDFRRSEYEIVDGKQLMDSDLPRVRELYNKLYLEKYSPFNPQFTEAFIRLARDSHVLNFKFLRHQGRIDAVMGYFVRNGLMTAPLFGYDTQLPQTLALYRLLSLQMIKDGMERGLKIHASAGVGPFKKLRGGIPVIEYNAVYDHHLPQDRRLPWSVLKILADKIAIPVFQKYGF